MPMRTIETGLWPLEQPVAELGVGVFLGEQNAPGLADLTEGERVVLMEPNELQAEGIVHTIQIDGRRVWFAELVDSDAIQVIYPDPPQHSRHPAKS